MIFRTAHASDVHAIAALHAENWRDAYRGILADRYLDNDLLAERLRLWTERFAAPGHSQHVILAEENADLLGFACIFGAHDPEHGTLLENLHVRGGRRGGGLGAALLQAVAGWTLEHQPGQGLHLWALEQNAKARRFYEHMGAVACGTSLWSPPVGDPVPEVRYRWADPRLLTEWEKLASRPTAR